MISTEKFPIQGKTISWDLDGILSHSSVPVLDVLNQLLFPYSKRIYSPRDITGWDSTHQMMIRAGKSEDEANKITRDTWFNGDVLAKAPPIDGAWALSWFFHKHGAKQFINTSREPGLLPSTRWWLKKWLPWIDEENIMIRSSIKDDGNIHKVDVIDRIKADYHFEDNHKQAGLIANETRVKVFYLPYLENAGKLRHKNVIELNRVNGLPNMTIALRHFIDSHPW